MKYYGPFYKSKDGSETWHWHKRCPDFPDSQNPETMICSSIPKQEILCDKCIELDVDNPKPYSFYDSSAE